MSFVASVNGILQSKVQFENDPWQFWLSSFPFALSISGMLGSHVTLLDFCLFFWIMEIIQLPWVLMKINGIKHTKIPW